MLYLLHIKYKNCLCFGLINVFQFLFQLHCHWSSCRGRPDHFAGLGFVCADSTYLFNYRNKPQITCSHFFLNTINYINIVLRVLYVNITVTIYIFSNQIWRKCRSEIVGCIHLHWWRTGEAFRLVTRWPLSQQYRGFKAKTMAWSLG